MDYDYYAVINEERTHLEEIARRPRIQLHSDMRTTLSRYFKHKPLLHRIIENDLFLSEYAFLERANRNEVLSQCLTDISKIYKSAKSADKARFYKLLSGYTSEVSKAADNYAQMDMLVSATLPPTTKPLVKLAFREIADLLEGSFQVFSKFLLMCIRIAQGKETAEVQSLSFGQCVGEIISNGLLVQIYQPSPWDISLSQWRNISAHSSYNLDVGSNLVVCEFGSKNRKLVELTIGELFLLKFNLGQFYMVHKISHSIVFASSYEKLKKYKPKLILNPETILHQIKEYTCSFGFFPKQSDSLIPLTGIQFEDFDGGGIQYLVTDISSDGHAPIRSKILAGKISSILKVKAVVVKVYDSSGTHICDGVSDSGSSLISTKAVDE